MSNDTEHPDAGPLKAVVLVAGVSRRLFPLTERSPKCLMDLGGRTIFDFQMEALRTAGVRDVCLVLGYRREQIIEHALRNHADLCFEFVINHHFFETNTAHSLWLAQENLRGRDFLYFNGDVLFEPRLLERVISGPRPASLAVEAKPCGEEEVKVIVADGRIRRIGKLLPPAECLGEFIGIARFGAPMTGAFFDALGELAAEGRRMDYFEEALDRIAPTAELGVADVTGLPVIEIDFPADLEAARGEILARLGVG
ncbi:MAG TPA: phosphocholine cytidylyltransferase family protein [Polyangia bacterium]|nr:phosphocholine cytidylyltransferase family protein [Polyangia bacterium]